MRLVRVCRNRYTGRKSSLNNSSVEMEFSPIRVLGYSRWRNDSNSEENSIPMPVRSAGVAISRIGPSWLVPSLVQSRTHIRFGSKLRPDAS